RRRSPRSLPPHRVGPHVRELEAPGRGTVRLLAADLPDDARAWNLHERRVGGIEELRLRISLTEVANSAVVDEIQIAVGAEHRGDRPVDTAELGHEGLFALAHALRGASGDDDLIGLRA